MFKHTKFWAVLLAVAMTVSCFAACDGGNGEKEKSADTTAQIQAATDTATEEETRASTVETNASAEETDAAEEETDAPVVETEADTEFIPDADITIRYESNGDGTCRVVGIDAVSTVSHARANAVIPEISPEGDRVVAIESIGNSLSLLPRMLLPEDWEIMRQKVCDYYGGDEDYFYYRQFCAYWSHKSLENVEDDLRRQELLDAYPICAATDVYVFDTSATHVEMALHCAVIAAAYPEYTAEQRRYDEWDKINQVAQEKGIDATGYDNRNEKPLVEVNSVVIPDSATSIGYQAFYYCYRLTSVTIPDSVTSIGWSAFYRCTSLKSITIPDSVTSIGEGAFSDTPYYNDETNWENGVLYIGKHLIRAQGTVAGEYAIKEGTLTIAGGAFLNCIGLTNVTIPDSVKSIGDRALSGTAYYKNESNWENGVLYMGKHLIGAQYTVTGEYAIKEGTLTIAGSTFCGCTGLTSATIPDSIRSIGGYAFSDCTNLTDIYFTGTEEEWNAIEGLANAAIPESATIHYNYDPESET